MNQTKNRTVTYRPQHKKCVPALVLQGNFLKKYGFDTGTKVEVNFLNEQIIIYAKKEKIHKRGL